MTGKKRDQRPEARLPKGMRDVEATEIRAMERMLGTIRQVYESYGFEPLDTPAFEYTDALGKFLPDQDRPNEGVFSFQDEDEQWLSLRYDLTAPLARYVAQNFDACRSRSAAIRPVRSGATRSQGRAASGSSFSSTPIRSGPTTSPPMRRFACSLRIRWSAWGPTWPIRHKHKQP